LAYKFALTSVLYEVIRDMIIRDTIDEDLWVYFRV
jgi:hypothetical protein